MLNINEELAFLRRRISEDVARANRISKDIFYKESVPLLETLDIESYSWTQYTPYFNDGDACVFGVYREPKIDGEWVYENPNNRDKGEVIEAFLNKFTDEEFFDMFGDHVEITVSADIGVVTSHVDHD